MKSIVKSFGTLLMLVVLAVLVAPPARATDLTYTTLPQVADNELVIQHKALLAAPSTSYSNLTSAATTTIKSGSGILEKIVINTGASTTTVTVYDNTAASGTKIATAATTTQGVLTYGCRFGTGLTVVTSGAADITVIYR